MDKFVKLIVLTEQETLHNISLLAQSVGIKVQQLSRSDVLQMPQLKAGTLLACPYHGVDLNKKGSINLLSIFQI